MLISAGRVFKFFVHNQLSEICTTSIEIVLFHDYGHLPGCDFLPVKTNHLSIAYVVRLWLTGNKNGNRVNWLHISDGLSNCFIAVSFLTLLLMNFDQYFATYYPFFHRTFATEKKLLTLVATLISVELVTADGS